MFIIDIMEYARKITGVYIAGFVDGEGCFSLTYRKDKGKYFYWKASFVITLKKDDKNILESIKEYLETQYWKDRNDLYPHD